MATSYVLVDSLVADLCEGGFSGVVEVMLRRADAYVVIAGGRVAVSLLAQHGEATGALMDASRATVMQITAAARQERGRVSIYRYSAETAEAIAGRATAQALYTRLSTEFADLDKVIAKLSRESDRQWFIEIILNDGQAALVHMREDGCRVLTSREGTLREAYESQTPAENALLATLLDQSRLHGGVFDVYFRSADDVSAASEDSAEGVSRNVYQAEASSDVAEVVKEAKAVFHSLSLDDTDTALPAVAAPRRLPVPPGALSALRELTGSLGEKSNNGDAATNRAHAADESAPAIRPSLNESNHPTFFKTTDDLLLMPDDLRATGLLKRGSQADAFAEIKRLMGEIVRTVEESVRAAGARDSFAISLRAGQLKVADRYSFLDPFAGEFEYLAGEIVFVGDASAAEFIAGLSEALAQAIDSAARASAQPDRIRLHTSEGLRWLLNRQRSELEAYHLDHAIEAIIAETVTRG
ncbi:MAG: hypothetical protein ACJ74J_04540 [Blastocatellia bacterium]